MSDDNNNKDGSKVMIYFILGLLIVMAILFTVNTVKMVYITNDEINTNVTNDELVVIDFAHEKVHEGEHFFYRNFTIIPNAGDYDIHFMTSNVTDTEIHMTIQVENEVLAEYTLYENVSIITNGSNITYFNRDRNIGDDNHIYLFLEPTYANGTIIAQNLFGSGKKFGGQGRDANELILRKNYTSYVLHIDNLASGSTNNINWVFDWYEYETHTG